MSHEDHEDANERKRESGEGGTTENTEDTKKTGTTVLVFGVKFDGRMGTGCDGPFTILGSFTLCTVCKRRVQARV
jgi:hypothetical protein